MTPSGSALVIDAMAPSFHMSPRSDCSNLTLVERDFTATRPKQLWVSDLTDVAKRDFVYVALGRSAMREAISHDVAGSDVLIDSDVPGTFPALSS